MLERAPVHELELLAIEISLNDPRTQSIARSTVDGSGRCTLQLGADAGGDSCRCSDLDGVRDRGRVFSPVVAPSSPGS